MYASRNAQAYKRRKYRLVNGGDIGVWVICVGGPCARDVEPEYTTIISISGAMETEVENGWEAWCAVICSEDAEQGSSEPTPNGTIYAGTPFPPPSISFSSPCA